MDEYADEDGNVSMKIRQRFRDTGEIRSRRRVESGSASASRRRSLREVTLARGTHELEGEAEEERRRDGGRRTAARWR